MQDNILLTSLNISKRHVIIISLLLLITRVIYLFSPAGRIGDSDEAVFGIMAQKIQALEEFPIYCWGAHYAGAVVSYIGAIIFYFLGSGFLQLRLAMLPAALITPLLFYMIYRRLYPASYAFIATLYLIFCPFFVLRYTMGAYGGYGETCLGTGLIILISWKIWDYNSTNSNGIWSFILGLTCGFFSYILFLIIPTVLSFAFPAIWREKTNRINRIICFIIGGLLGFLPFIIYNITNRGATFLRAAGRSFSIGREALQIPIATLFQQLIINKVQYLKTWLINCPEIFGNFIMPEGFNAGVIVLSGIFLVILLILLFIMTLFLHLRSNTNIPIWPFAVNVLFLILFQLIVNLNRPRHMIPLLFFIPIIFFTVGERYDINKKFISVLIISLCTFHVIGWMTQMRTSFLDPRPYVAEMNSKNIRHFYSSYWATYPIIFESKGTLIGSPMLLDKDDIFADRRPEFTAMVRTDPNPAFLFVHNEKDILSKFNEFLIKNRINAQRVEIEGSSLYFNLSQAVDAVVSSNIETNFISR